MSESSPASPTFTAVGVVTVGGRRLAADPLAFDLSGVHMILQSEPGGQNFGVVQMGNRQPGIARFEKTCTQPVTFLVSRDGKPYWTVEVKGMFDSMTLQLNAD